MGAKRSRKRKHVLLHLTCYMIVSFGFGGCSMSTNLLSGENHKRVTRISPQSKQIDDARKLLVAGKFDAALAKSEDVLKRYPDSNADRAIFQIGLIFAHPDYSRSDPRKSLKYFLNLQDKFPASTLNPETGVWIAVLREYIRQNTELTALYKNSNKEMERLSRQIDHLKANLKARQKQITEVNAKAEKLQKQIILLKEVDIVIEEKKRKLKDD